MKLTMNLLVLVASISACSAFADSTTPAGQDLNGAGQALKTAAVDVGHAAEFLGDKTVLVVETTGKDSYRYFFLPVGKDIEQGSKIVATDVRVATVDTAQITIHTAEGVYYFVGNVSEDFYHDGIIPGFHVVVRGAQDVGHAVAVGAEDVGHGVVVGAQAVGHGVSVAARAIGNFFTGHHPVQVTVQPPVVVQPAPAAEPAPAVNSVLDTDNGSVVVNSVEVTAPAN